MHDHNSLFVELQPPAGGLQRLQRSLANRHAAGPRGLRFALGGVLAMASLVLVTWLPGIVARQRQAIELRAAVRTATRPLANGILVSDGAALQLPSKDSRVRLYLVQTALIGPAPATPAAN